MISWPDRSTDDEDESTDPGDAEEERRSQQDVKNKVRVFREHRITQRGLLRLRNSILEAMCELNQLEVKNSKEDLVESLLDWVSTDLRSVPKHPLTSLLARVKLPRSTQS